MAKINKPSVYPIRHPDLDDMVVGTKVNENGKTVNFSVLEIASIAGSISENMLIRISDIEIIDGVLYVRNSEENISKWIINNIDYQDTQEKSFNITPTSENHLRNDLLVVTNNPEEPFVYIEGEEDPINYIEPEYNRLNNIKVIPIYINGTNIESGLINLGSQFISKESEEWTYLYTVDDNPVSINITNYRNFIVFKDLEHDVTITHTLNPDDAFLQQWYGWTHRVGRAIGGPNVTIKHNSVVDVLNSREVAYFFPDEKDYELKEGEILTFSTISKGIYLGEMLEKRVYTLISSNMTNEEVFKNDIIVSLTDNKTLGKYLNGQTIPAVGKTPEEVLRDIAIEYLSPSFTSFIMSGQTTTIEVGTIISGDKNFTFAFQYPDNVNANSISIIDVTNSNTVLASGLSKTSPVSAPVGSVTKTGVSSHQWRGRAMNSNSVSFDSGNFTVNWQFRYFRGSVANFPADGDALRTALLGDSIISNSNSMSFTTGTTNNKFVIAIPSHKTLVEAKNMGTNENLPFTLSPTITTVPDAGSTLRNYKVYTLENAVPFSSNYTINITLS